MLRRRLIALVVAETGFVAEIFAEDGVKPGFVSYKMLVHRLPDHLAKEPMQGWLHPYSLVPWNVLYLVEAVNDHRTTLIEGVRNFSERRLYEKLSKKMKIAKPIPQPFYTVYLHDKIIRMTARRLNRKMGIQFAYSHRFDRRAHTAARIMRGPLPLDAETNEWILKRGGYKVFTDEPVDDETRIELLRRHVSPKAANEWMAVKIWDRPYTVVGDESLPYVPANRKGTKGVLGYKDTTSSKREVELAPVNDFEDDDDENDQPLETLH